MRGYAENLVYDPDWSIHGLLATKNSDDTYSFYFKSMPNIKIYTSKKNKLDNIGIIDNCGKLNKTLGATFGYIDFEKNPDESVFFNLSNNELSPIYYGDFNYILCPSDQNLFVEPNSNDDNNYKALIIHPIFKSQPKTWIIIKRNFNTIFPGYPDP
jgi:hypothetical protein